MIGEGEYNVNVLAEIKATEPYLGLDQNIRECQNEEPYYNCTTRNYINNILSQCECLPLSIGVSNINEVNVTIMLVIQIPLTYKFKAPLCSPEGIECANKEKIETSSKCMKPCSGLIITSFIKSEKVRSLENLFSIFGPYNEYKTVTNSPVGFQGNQ